MDNLISINQKRRIGYIDALRGFTMFLVVFGHVELFGFSVARSFLGSLFLSFRMPMFFFISGFIAYKITQWDWSYYKQVLKKKAIVQLIPTLFFFYLFSACHGDFDLLSIFTKGPQGYWFTVVLFYMFFIYYTVMFFCKSHKSWTSDIILIVLSLIGAFAYIGGMKFYDLNYYPILCLINLSRYFEFFVFGILCRKYQKRFLDIISSDLIKSILFLSFIIVLYLDWNKVLVSYYFFHILNHEFIRRFIGLLFVYSIFYNYKDFYDSENPIAHGLRFVGRRTLDIYMIHYFLIPDLVSYRSVLLGALTPQNTILEFFVVLLFASLIIAMSLLISAIIRSSSTLGHYLLGVKITK